MYLPSLFVVAAIFQSTVAIPHAKPYEKWKRQSASSATRVDLGYEVYEGVANSSTRLNTFKGIRFAAPPVGSLRWQAPKSPESNRSAVISAADEGPTCPQSPVAPARGGAQGITGSEDCLFLNVFAPQNATDLPVLVWIHGGGYGLGSAVSADLSAIINANNNSFVGVAIQYRLGAFGFLASDEVHRNGVVNAGILDQMFALQWVQAYIHLFGGDPNQVTIFGESAGGGSVMLLDIAYGGTLGTSLFRNSITASPYLPQQWHYKDWVPSQSYYAFAAAAGCPATWAYGNSSQTIFECLVSQSTEKLQNASELVSASGTYGTWGFLPVTDDVFIQSTPSKALRERKVNGLNHLSGNNAQEGDTFVPHNITTENDLVDWIRLVFPLFTQDDIAKLLYYYPSSNVSDSSDGLTTFATDGRNEPTIVNVSQTATGQQQRVQAIYGESTFVCPSYWLAEAYNARGRTGYKYQYSVPLASHGADVAAYFGPPGPNLGPDFVLAFQRILGNFVATGNPSISASIASGSSSNATISDSGLDNWPVFALWNPLMVNLNQTGGTPLVQDLSKSQYPTGINRNVTVFIGPGLMNDISLVDGYSWEGGRGKRCDFWLSVADITPA
ncbi:carboxylesterase type B [Curvularia clavata]|uniref:Carboxylic ester hydrolase n=1 Tax=Curvularia clavata TaxID=95742 RepID=A0A9Q9DYC2_CURCL|nr:carboxylesterase type B [Curvularia clavata]